MYFLEGSVLFSCGNSFSIRLPLFLSIFCTQLVILGVVNMHVYKSSDFLSLLFVVSHLPHRPRPHLTPEPCLQPWGRRLAAHLHSLHCYQMHIPVPCFLHCSFQPPPYHFGSTIFPFLFSPHTTWPTMCTSYISSMQSQLRRVPLYPGRASYDCQ